MVQHGETQAIRRDMTIGEIVQEYPQVVETLMSFGVHCIGCGASYWETLEQGFALHGMSDKEINEAVAELNKIVYSAELKGEEVGLTSSAILKIKELAKKSKKGLRINIKEGGCAGHQYIFELSEKKKGDVEVKGLDVNVFVEKESFPKLKGAKIEYVDALQGAGFRVINPNAKATCGCGSSSKF